MNKKILVQVHSPDVELDLIKQYPEQFASIENLKAKCDRLVVVSVDLKDSLELREHIRKGKTATKSEARVRLEVLLAAGGGALKVYATDNDRNDLLEISALCINRATYMIDAEIGHLGQVLASKLLEVGEPLVKNGITTAKAQELKVAADAFAEATAAVGSALSNKKGLNTKIRDGIKEVRALQESISNLMLQFADTDPVFYSTYKAAIEKHHYPVRHRKNGKNGKPADDTSKGSDDQSR